MKRNITHLSLKYKPQASRGFTIVELLIVIVIIAILAAITIVAYNGIQNRAKDSQTRQAANQVAKAIYRYNLESGKQPYSGGTSVGNVTGTTVEDAVCPNAKSAGGFAGGEYYDCSIEELLAAAKLLPDNFITNGVHKNTYLGVANGKASMMFYNCYEPGASNKYILYYTLINPTNEETTNLDNLNTQCANSADMSSTGRHGMKAATLIQL